MPLLKNKLGAIYVPFLFNPDLILGGLLSVDATFITVDSDVFRADNHYNLTRGPQLVLNGNFSQEGSELVTNGDFATDSDWNLGAGQWTILNGFAVADNASNNLHTNNPVATATGLQYKVTFTLKDVTQGYVRVGLSSLNSTQFNSDGTYTLYIESSGNRYLYFTPYGFTGKLTNVSVKEVAQNWTFNNSGGSNGWRIADGKAICDSNAVTPNRNLNSAANLTAGKTYRLNLDILQSEDNMQIVVGATTLSQTLPTGTHINYEYIIEGSEHSGGVFALYAGSSDLQEVDNISIAEDTTYGPELVSNGSFSQIGIEEILNGSFSQEGSELVTNGDFTTDSNWTKLSNTTISGGKANFSNAGDVSLYQNIGVLSGSVKVTFSVTDYTSGGLKIYVGGYSIGTSLIEATAVGDYTVVMDTTSGNGNIIFGSTNNFTGSIDNVSVIEVGQNWDFNNDVSIGDGVATFLDGGSNPNTQLVQSNILTSGKNYKITFDVARYVAGNVQVFIGSSAVTYNVDISNGVGTYTLHGVSTGADLTIKRNGGYPNFDFDVTNISVKEVGQDWTLSSGSSIENGKLTIDALDGTYQYARQIVSTTVGSTYKLEFDITEINNVGKVQLLYNSVVIGEAEYASIGTHILYFESTYSSGTLEIKRRHPSNTNVSIDNISVKEDRSLNIL